MKMSLKKESVALKGSASSLNNNLSVFRNDSKNLMSFAVVHKSVVNVVIDTGSDAPVVRQVLCKEPSSAHGTSMILQAKFVTLAGRVILVITSQRGIQMFSGDGSSMLYWHSLGDINAPGVEVCFGRGVTSVGDSTVCVGMHEGHVLVFNVPNTERSSNIKLEEVVKGHRSPITDLSSDGERMFSADDDGNIGVWEGEPFKKRLMIPGDNWPATSIGVCKDIIVAGYGSGHLRLFSATTGNILAEACAHARWISAIDVTAGGLILTVGQDAQARIWQLRGAGERVELDHRHNEHVADQQLVGGAFIDKSGASFAVTGYDCSSISVYS